MTILWTTLVESIAATMYAWYVLVKNAEIPFAKPTDSWEAGADFGSFATVPKIVNRRN